MKPSFNPRANTYLVPGMVHSYILDHRTYEAAAVLAVFWGV